MINKELFKKVKSLNLPRGEYALFGSAPMGVRGMRNCHDIDIIVTEKIWNEYRNKFEWKLKKSEEPDKYSDGLINDDIELWKDWWQGWDIKKLIQEAEIIDGLPFVKLNEVLRWKKQITREKELKPDIFALYFLDDKKDLEDVKIIENFLKNNK